MYTRTNPKQSVSWGDGEEIAIATYTDGYSTISLIEDDHCIVFVHEPLTGTGEQMLMQWIPIEILQDYASTITAEIKTFASNTPL